ncbi:MAG: discoidin domain-containing protein, partial [Patescibacteria group bacterium]|nr:discoidin domain-containing protein [Patescibacteria group bacterium]MDD4611335.1 discoidin domain-containing protein [Patescibacteria group bacterium]
MFYFFSITSAVLLFLLVLVYFSYKKNITIPLIGKMIRNQYLKSRFKIWDDLEKAKKNKQGEKKLGLFAKFKFRIHKFEATFFYYLALLFKSPRESFILLNCDREEIECLEDDYPKHLTKQKRVATISIYVILILIIANISTGLITSFIFPNIFKSLADFISHPIAGVWDGTGDSDLNVATDINLRLSASANSYSQTSYADFAAGTASSALSLSENPGNIQLAKNINIEWTEGGKELETAQINGGGTEVVTDIADGVDTGGSIIVWESSGEIKAQKIDQDGNEVWAAGGVTVSASSSQEPKVISDGLGGAIVIWIYNNGTDEDVYAQRLASADGSDVWAADVVISDAAGAQNDARIISDETAAPNGAIIVWTDGRNGAADIYAQRLAGSDGSAIWTAGGVKIADDASNLTQHNPEIVSDGANGAVVAWLDDRNGDSDVYAQRISGTDGSYVWPVAVPDLGGVAMSSSGSKARELQIISDGANGAIMSWQNQNFDPMPVYVQRVDATDGMAKWTAGGVMANNTSDSDYTSEKPRLTIDGANGAIITWSTIGAGGYDPSIRAQRIIGDTGVKDWGNNGVVVCDTSGDWAQRNVAIASDGVGGAFISWNDWRDNPDSYIYMQRIDSSGSGLWAENGVIVSGEIDENDISTVISDENAMVFWNNSDTGILYAQRINSVDSYFSSGVFTSSIISADSVVSWSTLSTSETTPANTSISYKTRTSQQNATNLSDGATVTVDSVYTSGFEADHAVDGSTETLWASETNSNPHWLKIDLGSAKTVGGVYLNFYVAPYSSYMPPHDYTIETSLDDSDYERQATVEENDDNTKTTNFTPVSARYIKINVSHGFDAGGGVAAIAEAEVYEGDYPVWSDWETVTGGVIASPAGRSIQYRATLSTTDTSATPVVSSVTLSHSAKYGDIGDAVVVGQADFSGISGNQGGSVGANTIYGPIVTFWDGTHFFVSDAGNNRVLIYNGIPTSNNASADVVIGQEDFTGSDANQGSDPAANTLYTPDGIYSDGTRLFIADWNNNRVLIYNHIPTENNASADVVIGQEDFTSNQYNHTGDISDTAANTLAGPWGVFYDGTHLFIADMWTSRVLIYNHIPTENNHPADVVIGQEDFNGFGFNQSGETLGDYDPSANTLAVPNNIYSDGTHLFIADSYNNRVLVYNHIPTENNHPADV